MQAKPGDRLTVTAHRVGQTAKHAEILEVRGDKERQRYRVRWADGHESLVYPGSDVVIERKSRKPAAA